MRVFTCDKDTLTVLDKFLACFHVSNKVNFQNCFANKLISRILSRLKHSVIASCFKPDKTLLLVFETLSNSLAYEYKDFTSLNPKDGNFKSLYNLVCFHVVEKEDLV